MTRPRATIAALRRTVLMPRDTRPQRKAFLIAARDIMQALGIHKIEFTAGGDRYRIEVRP